MSRAWPKIHETAPNTTSGEKRAQKRSPQRAKRVGEVVTLYSNKPDDHYENETLVRAAGESVLPPTNLDVSEVKETLLNEQLSIEERIGRLLNLAYRNGTVIESSIPPQLRTRITENPADWYHAHAEHIDVLLKEGRSEIANVYERTEPYEPTPFLRNAAKINELSWIHRAGEIGKRTELAARLIITEAMMQD